MALASWYADDELSNALRTFYNNSSSSSSDVDKSCAHILGYTDPQHTMSMLQRITATIILDYEQRLLPSSCSPSMDELLTQASQFHVAHGPILNLQSVISNQYPAMGLAAEFKRASPSKGPIAPNLKAGEQASLYYEAGACVISVLTEGHWFGGSLDDLTEARLATSTKLSSAAAASDDDDDDDAKEKKSRPAILRKDFITSTYQIAEAAAAGADTILLIVAILPATLLAQLIDYARTVVNMEPLVEVHSHGELNVAFDAGARVLGVNNRNLHTFTLDMECTDNVALELTKRGLSFHPDDNENSSTVVAAEHRIILCALSGMSTLHDVHRYRQVGVSMCLIGESLMRSPDVRSAIRGLCLDPIDYYNSTHNNGGSSSIVVEEEGREVTASSVAAGGAYIGGMKIIKICGITTPHDALVACRAGANLIGIIFAEKSKRKVSTVMATEIVSVIREFGERSNRISIALDDDNDDGNVKKAGFGGNESSFLGGASVISTLVVRARTLEQITSRRPIVVGVFQNQSIDYIKNIVNECGLDMIQLHGNEGMEAAHSKNYGVPAIRVVDIELGSGDECDDEKKLSSAEIASTILGKVTTDPYAILLDTSGGGTGLTFDWTIAESLQNMGLPVIVAGGLTPDNIGMVVGGTRPWGVDVAGGVEAGPGIKDCDKVCKFVVDARSAAVEADKGF